MSRVAIGVVAERVVLAVGDGDDVVFLEMVLSEAIKVAGLLDSAICAVDADQGNAGCFAEFLEWFE